MFNVKCTGNMQTLRLRSCPFDNAAAQGVDRPREFVKLVKFQNFFSAMGLVCICYLNMKPASVHSRESAWHLQTPSGHAASRIHGEFGALYSHVRSSPTKAGMWRLNC